MYICRTCGSLFSTPQFNKQGKSVCPDCGATDITEANYCRICHDYFIGCPTRDYCPDCVLNAEDQLRNAVDKWVDPDYVELLRAEYSDLDYVLGDENE